MHARITAYKGMLVLELLATKSISNEVATSLDTPGNMGQVIMDTAKHLGVSIEALELMKPLRRGHDDLGDIDWFQSTGSGDCFAWLGGPYAIKDPKKLETSSSWRIGAHQVITNEVPAGARQFIDSQP